MKKITLKRTFITGLDLQTTLQGMEYVFKETLRAYGIEEKSRFLLTIKIEKLDPNKEENK